MGKGAGAASSEKTAKSPSKRRSSVGRKTAETAVEGSLSCYNPPRRDGVEPKSSVFFDSKLFVSVFGTPGLNPAVAEMLGVLLLRRPASLEKDDVFGAGLHAHFDRNLKPYIAAPKAASMVG